MTGIQIVSIVHDYTHIMCSNLKWGDNCVQQKDCPKMLGSEMAVKSILSSTGWWMDVHECLKEYSAQCAFESFRSLANNKLSSMGIWKYAGLMADDCILSSMDNVDYAPFNENLNL